MGNCFNKNKNRDKYKNSNIVIPERDMYQRFSHSDIKKVIQHYEYIKDTKLIKDIDIIIPIMQHTDWDKTTLVNRIEPSAPPLYLQIPMAEAHFI